MEGLGIMTHGNNVAQLDSSVLKVSVKSKILNIIQPFNTDICYNLNAKNIAQHTMAYIQD
jgi:hypothetical protein